jgi:hypothetical protein
VRVHTPCLRSQKRRNDESAGLWAAALHRASCMLVAASPAPGPRPCKKYGQNGKPERGTFIVVECVSVPLSTLSTVS